MGNIFSTCCCLNYCQENFEEEKLNKNKTTIIQPLAIIDNERYKSEAEDEKEKINKLNEEESNLNSTDINKLDEEKNNIDKTLENKLKEEKNNLHKEYENKLNEEKNILHKENENKLKEQEKIYKDKIAKLEIELKKNKEIIKELDNSPILIGLNNIGATCYMNATLQALSNTKDFTQYFLYVYNYNPKDTSKIMSNEFYNLLNLLWDKNKRKGSFSPNDFKETLAKKILFLKEYKQMIQKI